jgi:hypothetical protein
MLCFVVGDMTSEGRDVNGWNLCGTGAIFYRMLRVARKRGQEPGSWNGGMWNHGNDCDSRRDSEERDSAISAEPVDTRHKYFTSIPRFGRHAIKS